MQVGPGEKKEWTREHVAESADGQSIATGDVLIHVQYFGKKQQRAWLNADCVEDWDTPNAVRYQKPPAKRAPRADFLLALKQARAAGSAPGKCECFCQMPPQGRFMVSCDSCNSSYHAQCVGIVQPPPEMEHKVEPFTCDACTSSVSATAPKATATTKAKAKAKAKLKAGIDKFNDGDGTSSTAVANGGSAKAARRRTTSKRGGRSGGRGRGHGGKPAAAISDTDAAAILGSFLMIGRTLAPTMPGASGKTPPNGSANSKVGAEADAGVAKITDGVNTGIPVCFDDEEDEQDHRVHAGPHLQEQGQGQQQQRQPKVADRDADAAAVLAAVSTSNEATSASATSSVKQADEKGEMGLKGPTSTPATVSPARTPPLSANATAIATPSLCVFTATTAAAVTAAVTAVAAATAAATATSPSPLHSSVPAVWASTPAPKRVKFCRELELGRAGSNASSTTGKVQQITLEQLDRQQQQPQSGAPSLAMHMVAPAVDAKQRMDARVGLMSPKMLLPPETPQMFNGMAAAM